MLLCLATPCSQMQLNRIFRRLSPLVLLRDPDRTLLGEDPIGTNPMTVGTEDLQLPLSKLHRLNNNPGVNLADTIPEDVGVAEVPTLVFPGPSHSSNLNDNYCSKPNRLYVKVVEGKSVCCQTQCSDGQKIDLDVSCPVVFHAPTVHSPGLPQKKGVRPVPYQNKIKHVKDVCCVNPCLFVPLVSNVPSAVPEQNVGGRL